MPESCFGFSSLEKPRGYIENITSTGYIEDFFPTLESVKYLGHAKQ